MALTSSPPATEAAHPSGDPEPTLDDAAGAPPARAAFAARRQRLLAAIGPDAAVLVTSLPERVRNGDAHYRFRQHSDVYYLTGFEEPQAAVLLRSAPSRQQPSPPPDGVTMFVRPRDPDAEIWDGPRLGIAGAVTTLGADRAYPTAELRERLAELIANCDQLHYAVGLDDKLDAIVAETIAGLRKTERRGKRPPRAIIDPLAVLHELRLRKDDEELAALRRAAAITSEAHCAAMRAGRPGVAEHELEALLEYTFRRRGGNGPGYTSIVGAGANATVLHYIANRATVRQGDLVLIDAGCEYDHYTADVTRTFPADGRFSGPQREVYELALATQRSAIAMVRPGATIDQLYQHCARQLTDGMIQLGLLHGPLEDRLADASYRRYFPHGVSHWLGLDVHDAGAYAVDGDARPLLPGMVITVEPGLYIADLPEHPAALRGLGVRIEDDVLVTADGHEVLTAACPKSIDDVEHACRQ